MISKILSQMTSRDFPYNVTKQMDAHGRVRAQKILHAG